MDADTEASSRRRRLGSSFPVVSREDGAASLEFITAGMILLVPFVYLILTLSAIQSGSFAVEGAARQAARVYVAAADEATARNAAERAIVLTLSDYGIDERQARISVTCSPVPRDCLQRRSYVTVTIDIAVALPLTPPALSVDAPATVRLSSAATQQVSRFWSAG